MLSALDIALVQSQFRAIVGDGDRFAATFRRRLQVLAPWICGSDGTGRDASTSSLITVLAPLIADLDRIEDFGRQGGLAVARNPFAGSAEDHAAIGEALLDALEAHFGDGFSDLARDAWCHAFAAISDATIETV